MFSDLGPNVTRFELVKIVPPPYGFKFAYCNGVAELFDAFKHGWKVMQG